MTGAKQRERQAAAPPFSVVKVSVASTVLAKCARPLLLLLLVGCAGKSMRAPQPAVEVRIDNQNWNTVRVFVVSVKNLGGMGRRIATVSSLEKTVVFTSPPREFVLRMVSELDGRVWHSARYKVNRPCLQVTVERYFLRSSVNLCMGGRENGGRQ